jgi:5-(carboxyamino)imidazole ribonucleotide synthase
MSMPEPILPGATIGILGGGQLARMLALAAQPMGYHVVVLDPDPQCPAAAVCDHVIVSAFDDNDGLALLAGAVDVVTLEFESVPSEALEALEALVPVRPGRHVLEIARDRIFEKTFLNNIGVETAPWAAIETDTDFTSDAVAERFPAIMKTSTLGYDGKGQARVADIAEAREAWQQMGRSRCVIESLVDFSMEISVIVARTPSGEQRAFAPFENQHRNGILDITLWPARIDPLIAESAVNTALEISREINAIGLLTIEMFVTRATEAQPSRIVVNEIAPRPHNSGHVTIEASPTSQFAQAIRAVCDLPLGNVTPHSPGAMANLLGHLWADEALTSAAPPHSLEALQRGATLHLYGKSEARPGRKMGHITALGSTHDEALRVVSAARSAIET